MTYRSIRFVFGSRALIFTFTLLFAMSGVACTTTPATPATPATPENSSRTFASALKESLKKATWTEWSAVTSTVDGVYARRKRVELAELGPISNWSCEPTTEKRLVPLDRYPLTTYVDDMPEIPGLRSVGGAYVGAEQGQYLALRESSPKLGKQNVKYRNSLVNQDLRWGLHPYYVQDFENMNTFYIGVDKNGACLTPKSYVLYEFRNESPVPVRIDTQPISPTSCIGETAYYDDPKFEFIYGKPKTTKIRNYVSCVEPKSIRRTLLTDAAQDKQLVADRDIPPLYRILAENIAYKIETRANGNGGYLATVMFLSYRNVPTIVEYAVYSAEQQVPQELERVAGGGKITLLGGAQMTVTAPVMSEDALLAYRIRQSILQ